MEKNEDVECCSYGEGVNARIPQAGVDIKNWEGVYKGKENLEKEREVHLNGVFKETAK